MERFTDLLTLYFPQPCLDNGGRHAEIKQVTSYMGNRLSSSKGNVNLTDYWYTMLEGFQQQDMQYTCQHIGLLSDENPDWWREQLDNGKSWLCLCFIKLNLENDDCRTAEEKMKDIVGNYKCFRTFGNADFIFAFSEKSDKALKEKLDNIKAMNSKSQENTGRRIFFSNYYLCGECIYKENGIFRIEKYEVDDGGGCQTHDVPEYAWCKHTMEEIREKIAESKNKVNKKMMAYYQGLGQIVNIITQYEQPEIYKDLFFMFFPPIQLFMKQLKDAEDEIEACANKEDSNAEALIKNEAKNTKYIKMHKVEVAISEFIDSMEVLLHHMGHSCRDILSDAGRGGIPYDIPIRLCLMYTAYLHVLTRLLNDETYEFEYCLAPLTYSRPGTTCLDFGLPPGDRLIRVQISKHMMFMPRTLLIILAHEASHYVSNVPRARKLRAECLVKIANMAVVHYLLPPDILQKLYITESEELNQYLETLRCRIYAFMEARLWKNWDQKDENDKNFYLDDFSEDLRRKSMVLLEGEDQLLTWYLDYVDLDTVESLKEEGKRKDLFRAILSIQDYVKVQRMLLWNKKPLHNFMESIERNLKEVYADLSAILLLDLTPDNFLESYIISESYVPDEDVITPELINRIAMVKYVLQQGYEKTDSCKNWKNLEKWKNWTSDDELNCNLPEASEHRSENVTIFLNKLKKQVDSYILAYIRAMGMDVETANDAAEDDGFYTTDDLFGYLPVFEIEKIYCSECFNRIKEHLESENSKEDKKYDGKTYQALLQELFQHFQTYEKSQDTSYKAFFEDYERLIACYRGNIRKVHQGCIMKLHEDKQLQGDKVVANI